VTGASASARSGASARRLSDAAAIRIAIAVGIARPVAAAATVRARVTRGRGVPTRSVGERGHWHAWALMFYGPLQEDWCLGAAQDSRLRREIA